MADFPYRCALIIGVGTGISASLARRLSKIGLQVGLASRDVEKLRPLAEETAAAVFAVDASQAEPMAKLFLDMEGVNGGAKCGQRGGAKVGRLVIL